MCDFSRCLFVSVALCGASVFVGVASWLSKCSATGSAHLVVFGVSGVIVVVSSSSAVIGCLTMVLVGVLGKCWFRFAGANAPCGCRVIGVVGGVLVSG